MPELLIPYKGGFLPCMYDEQDHEIISTYSWYTDGRYAKTTINGRILYMHRLILGLSEGSKYQGDHIDHNGLNNQRSNLRVCTPQENRRNSRKLKPSAHSNLKGVYNDQGRWHAQIVEDGKVKNIGRFSNAMAGAKKYDQMALALHGDYAHINYPSSREAMQLQFPWIN